MDQSGLIFETTYDQSGEVLDENVVGRVSDLPVVDEYLDEQGRLVSQVKDDLGTPSSRSWTTTSTRWKRGW